MSNQVNCEEANYVDNSPGITHAGMLMNQQVVNPGKQKFKKDFEGVGEPIETFQGTESASEHIPTPSMNMTSRENTCGDNSTTLHMLDSESDEEWSANNGSPESSRFNSISIKN